MGRALWRLGRGAEAARVAALVRARFALPAEAVVAASELRCGLPGCPPVETIVLAWDGQGQRHRLRVFRPLAEVTEEDLPPRWYFPALADDGTDEGCC